MSPLLLLLLLPPLLLLGLLRVCAIRGRKRRADEPPLITGWIPFIGKALEFARDPYTFLEEQRKKFGDVFTVHIAGKYMTFIMDPFMYPSFVKSSRQLDFHKFTDKVVPDIFAYPAINSGAFPGLKNKVKRSFKLLQGEDLAALTESMMLNLMLLLRQDHMGGEGGWRSAGLYKFCSSVMFEATFLTVYGRPVPTGRHSNMDALREDFVRFDSMFPLLVAQVPIALLRRAKKSRDRIIEYLLPHRMSRWCGTSRLIRRRMEILDQQEALRDVDKAGHHLAILWASVANTVPAAFWTLYYLLLHLEALEVVHQEIHHVLNLSGSEFSTDQELKLSREQLNRLLYMESSINESLRLSSASINIRVAEEDFTLQLDSDQSAAVRKDDIVVLFPQSLHMDADIYEEPQTFRFDRYIQDGRQKTDFYKDGKKLRYYHMPFGSGATMCPGRFFAINEIKQFLCVLLLYFDLELEEGQTRATVDTSRAGVGVLMPTTDVRFRYRAKV